MTSTVTLSSPLRIPNFRYLWLGLLFISSGVQFYAVALTWLVLELTGSSAQLGIILAVGAVPRAIMMLFSGAIIDRSPPRRLLVITSLGSGVVTAVVAALLQANLLTVVILGIAGILLGLMDAFFYPTSSAVVARTVERPQLAQASAFMQGGDGLINMLAPAASGVVIGAVGLEWTFVLNALLFVIGFLLLWQINPKLLRQSEPSATDHSESYLRAVINGFRYAIQRPAVRLSLLVIAALNFAAIGPTIVGTAILVEQRFGGDASMYGILLSAYGVGGLIGSLIAGRIGFVRRPGRILISTAIAVGLSLIGTGFAQSFWVAFVIQAASGIVIGAGMPFFSAWLQSETELHMQGRVSSLVAFAAVAVDPFSQSAAGFMSQINLTLMFGVAGGLMLLTALIVAFNPAAHVEVEPTK